MTPEKKVKDKVKKILKDVDAYSFMPATHGFGTSGVPDIVACHQGKFIGIECKAGKGKPTALQEKNLNEIFRQGGVAVLINERGIDAFKMFMDCDMPSQGIYLDLLGGSDE